MARGSPDWSPKIISSASDDEQVKVSASDVDAAGTFSQSVQSVLIYNDGPNALHYNRDAAATTNNFKIPAKAWLMIDVPMTSAHFICATGETATVYLIGVW